MAHLNIDDAQALAGPDWLRTRRVEAATRALATPMPDNHEEVWRYSRVSELDLEEFSLATGAPGSGVDIDSTLAPLGEIAAAVSVIDGRVAGVSADSELDRVGVRVGSLGDHPGGDMVFGSVLVKPTDAFADLNNGFTADPVVVDVPEGVRIERPIVIVDWVATDGVVTFPRLIIRGGAGSEFNVIEIHGSEDVRSVSCPVTEVDVAPSARVGYFNLQRRGERFWQIASHVSRVERDASFLSAQVALGGDYARTRTDCRLVGTGAHGNLLAGYFARRNQMLDFRTFQKHSASRTTSNLLFKGALDDSSRSVYTGMIRVDKGAKGCDAMQTNENVKLGEDTWTESVPNLEINNDDVRCTHASKVGPVEEDQLFYLESRGVQPAVAERLIVSGLYEEVFAQVPVPELVDIARHEIDGRLGVEPVEI